MAALNTPPYTWRGVLEHLSGFKNFSGHNGLGTYMALKNPWEFGPVSIGHRQRYYGDVSSRVSTSVSAKIPTPIPGVDGSLGAKLGAIEASGALKGKFSLLDMFKLARDLAQNARQLAPLAGFLNNIIARLPNVEISGEMAVYVGMSSSNIWFVRLQSGAGVKFKLGIGSEVARIEGISGSMGRSWQIQLTNWQAHIPGFHQFNY